MVKVFGCRQAYESLSCRNPWTTCEGYGDFDLRLMSTMVRRPPGSFVMDAVIRSVAWSARCRQPGRRLVVALSALMITMDACGSFAGD